MITHTHSRDDNIFSVGCYLWLFNSGSLYYDLLSLGSAKRDEKEKKNIPLNKMYMKIEINVWDRDDTHLIIVMKKGISS